MARLMKLLAPWSKVSRILLCRAEGNNEPQQAAGY